MNKIAISLLMAVAVVLGGMTFLQSKRAASLDRQIRVERQSAVEARGLAASREDQISDLERRIDRLEEDNADLPGLRGEVTDLRKENERLTSELVVAKRSAEATRSQLVASQETARNQATRDGIREMTLSQAPAHIRNKIAQQYSGARISEVVQHDEDGKTFYSLEGIGANDRELWAMMDANGEILEQKIGMSFREVPSPVRAAVGRELRRDGGIDMTQVWENGRTTYHGNTEQNGQEIAFTFSEDGELVRYETWVEQPEK